MKVLLSPLRYLFRFRVLLTLHRDLPEGEEVDILNEGSLSIELGLFWAVVIFWLFLYPGLRFLILDTLILFL